MSTFVGIPPFSNPLWIALETNHFHIAQANFFRLLGGPNEQFGTHEKLSGGAR